MVNYRLPHLSLIFVTGVPGSGKSVLCEGFGGQQGLKDLLVDVVYYDKDVVKTKMANALGLSNDQLSWKIYERLIRQTSYGFFERLALLDLQGKPKHQQNVRSALEASVADYQRTLASHDDTSLFALLYQKIVPAFIESSDHPYPRSVLVNGTYAKEVSSEKQAVKLAQRWHALVDSSGARLYHFRCSLDETMLFDRLRSRGNAHDVPKLENPRRFLNEEPIHTFDCLRPIYIDAGLSYTQRMQQVLDVLLEK